MGRKNVGFGIALLFFINLSLKSKAQFVFNTNKLYTPLLYVVGSESDFKNKYNLNPVWILNSRQKLILEFDDLLAKHRLFTVKIFHLDQNGKRSKLRDFQYLNENNEFFINDFEVSQGPKLNFYHYSFIVPKPKISGEYELCVYTDESEEPILVKPFKVLNSKINVNAELSLPKNPDFWKTKQELSIALQTGDYFINFPQKELIVKVAKNGDWASAKTLNANNLVRRNSKDLYFSNFENQLLFDAGNEFRVLDISNFYSKGTNVGYIERAVPAEIITLNLKDRKRQNYVQSFDQNGNYRIINVENQEPDLGSDYAVVKFIIEKPEGKQYNINGGFTDWQKKQFTYDNLRGYYEATFLLKQGFYDFCLEEDGQSMEGDFSETGNTYEVFVYQLVPGKAFQELIGYKKVQTMGRP